MDECEYLGDDPAWLLMAELAAAALRQGSFQLAYLLDTSKGDICRQFRREADVFDRLMREFIRDPRQEPLAA